MKTEEKSEAAGVTAPAAPEPGDPISGTKSEESTIIVGKPIDEGKAEPPLKAAVPPLVVGADPSHRDNVTEDTPTVDPKPGHASCKDQREQKAEESPTNTLAFAPVGEVVMIPVEDVEAHPTNAKIYSKSGITTLVESIKVRGIITPVTVRRIGKKFQILSGHRRVLAAHDAGLTQIPVRIVEISNETAAEEHLVHGNLQREKTNEERIREFLVSRDVEAVHAKKRQNTRGRKGGKNPSQAKTGKADDIAADALGMSRPTAKSGAKVVAAIDRLIVDGKAEEAEDLRTVLNERSIDGALKAAMAAGYIEKPIKAKTEAAGQQMEQDDKPAEGASGSHSVHSAEPSQAEVSLSQGGHTESPNDSQNKNPKPQSDKSPEAAAMPTSEATDAVSHEFAYQAADQIVTFLRSGESAHLSTAQKNDWKVIVTQMVRSLKTIGVTVKAA